MNSKKWFIGIILSLILFFAACGMLVFLLDPFMHYRQATHGMIFYTTTEPDVERYLNSGIIRNFSFDAVIAGTSMTENFKTSEFDRLFGVRSVKLPTSGGTFKEVNDTCARALERHSDLKIILRGLDLNMINCDKDMIRFDFFPEYLYDDNRINDVNYLFGKNALLKGCMVDILMMVIRGKKDFLFDQYANWNDMFTYGREAVVASYERPVKSSVVYALNDEEKKKVRENVEQNVILLAKSYPKTRFICFLTPYSICYWDELSQNGTLQKELEIQEEMIELLISCENIELYSFCDNFDLITNLDNYHDQGHYSEEINSKMLAWIEAGDYRITKDNYGEYIARIRDFYVNYDYDCLYWD